MYCKLHTCTKNSVDPLADLEHHPIQIVASHQGSISNIKVDPLTPFTFGFQVFPPLQSYLNGKTLGNLNCHQPSSVINLGLEGERKKSILDIFIYVALTLPFSF